VPFTQVRKLDTLRSTMKRKAWGIRLLTLPAVALLAIGCTGAGPTAPQPVALASLEGTSWQAEDIDGAGVVAGVQPTLIFDAGQKVAGRTVCNRYFGTYRQTDDTLEIKPGGMTRMACPSAVMDQETKFLAALEAVRKARREGDTLMLLDGDGRVRMRLRLR
jgi:heat shock protein HslJ